jgi:hypothetical protein
VTSGPLNQVSVVVPDDASRRGAVFVSGLLLPDMSIVDNLLLTVNKLITKNF